MTLRPGPTGSSAPCSGDALGPDDDRGLTRYRPTVVDRGAEPGVQRRAHRRSAARLEHVGVEDVGSAQESGDERGGGRGVDLLRRADLLDAALGQHGDLVAHGERFLLVVGHVDERDADLALHARAARAAAACAAWRPARPAARRAAAPSGAAPGPAPARPAAAGRRTAGAGRRLAKSPIRTSSSASPTRRLVSSRDAFWYLSPNATLSHTVMNGNSA